MMIISGLLGNHIPTTKTLRAVMLVAVALGAGAVFGQGHTLWQDGGVRLCGGSSSMPMTATSDSAGGAIVVWQDNRSQPPYPSLYAQRVDAAGVPLWADDGVLVCYPDGGGWLAATDDGRHGVLAVWSGGLLAVQRVSADGAALWGPQGLELRPPNIEFGYMPALVRDGHGGAIVVWTVFNPYAEADTLIASRVDSSGTKQWETVVRADTMYDPPSLCPDGLGGVIIAWSEDGITGPVRVQRVDSAGAIRWASSGVLACTLSTVKAARTCVAVGESCFVVGFAIGPGDTWHNRAQMFDLAGNRLWGPTGVPVAGTTYASSGDVVLPADDHRQSIWLWYENRTGARDFFAQKLDSAGSRRWDSAGVFVGSSGSTPQGGFSATVDGKGGAIAAWPLFRTDGSSDIYAQHVDSAGHLCWSDTGLAVCRDPSRQEWTPDVVTDGDGGAIIAWHSYQSGVGSGTYAQRVADGSGVEEPLNAEVQATNTGPTVVRGVLDLQVGSRQNTGYRAELADVSGRKVLDLQPGANDVRALAPGVYFVRKAQAQAQAVQKVIITR
jgi:hypothetical protein